MGDKKPAPSDDLTNLLLMALGAMVGIALLGIVFRRAISWYVDFINRLYGASAGTVYFIVAVVFIIIDALLIVFITQTLKKYRVLMIRAMNAELASQKNLRTASPTTDRTEVPEVWVQIAKLAESDVPSDWNMAVIRADALFDEMLKSMGYQGDTVADRLRIVDTTQLKSVDRIWSAHRLRNMIAHDPKLQHTKETIAQALYAYEHGLEELGFLVRHEQSSPDMSRGTTINISQ